MHDGQSNLETFLANYLALVLLKLHDDQNVPETFVRNYLPWLHPKVQHSTTIVENGFKNFILTFASKDVKMHALKKFQGDHLMPRKWSTSLIAPGQLDLTAWWLQQRHVKSFATLNGSLSRHMQG